MKTLKLISAVVFVAATLATASAQRMMMMGGGGGGAPAMIMFNFREGTVRDDVSKELKLTSSQITKLEEMQAKAREEMMGMFQGGGGERPNQEEMQTVFKKMQEAQDKALKEILDEKQRTRLRQLWIQRQGNSIIMNPDIQKELKITDGQKEKIKALQDKQQEVQRSVMEKMQNGEIDREEIRPLMEKNRKTMDDELGKILTAEQKSALDKMRGEPFKFDDGN